LRDFHFSSSAPLPRSIDQSRATPADDPDHHPGAIAQFPDRDVFASWLTLPVCGDRLYNPPSREMREALERSNAGVLGFLLQEVDLEAMPRPADERLGAALAPLRIKLDMLIDIMARHSYRDIALPPASTVELSRTHIVWHSRQYWQCADWLRLELYFHPIFREPVSLLAKVTSCIEREAQNGCEVKGDLVEMLGSTSERLTRLVFLTQRQQQIRHRQRNAAGFEK
jgi:hypothetical protein